MENIGEALPVLLRWRQKYGVLVEQRGETRGSPTNGTVARFVKVALDGQQDQYEC